MSQQALSKTNPLARSGAAERSFIFRKRTSAQTLMEFSRVLQPRGVLGVMFRLPDEEVVLKEEFLPETAPDSEHLVYYRNLYSDAYALLTHCSAQSPLAVFLESESYWPVGSFFDEKVSCIG